VTAPARRRTPWPIVVGRVVVLVVIWVALWGTFTVGNILSGLIVVAVVTWLFPGGPGRLPPEHEGSFRPLAAVHFAAFFSWALVKATTEVALTVLRPASRLSEGIVAVPLRSRSPVIATIVADSITLTPGTLTIEVERDDEGGTVLYVHALGVFDPNTVREDGWSFERLAAKAFGNRRDRALCEAPPPSVDLPAAGQPPPAPGDDEEDR
jgi:multicomponent Na+:H+ antiporter subunit E